MGLYTSEYGARENAPQGAPLCPSGPRDEKTKGRCVLSSRTSSRAEPKLTIAQRTRVRRSSDGAQCLLGRKQPLSHQLSYYLSSQTLHPRGVPNVHRDCSGEWPLLCGCWRRGVQGPPLYGAAGALPLSVQGLLVGLFEGEGHKSQEVPFEPPLTFLSLQVSSRPEV